MTIDPPSGEEEHADNIVELAAYDAPKPSAPKEFLPWHRPRKQYVRHRQWRREILQMIKDEPRTDGVLKYLGLPGVDLLDLRYFHSKVCLTQKVNLRFLGFNSSAQPKSDAHFEMNISLDEVRRLTHIDPMSEMVSDKFQLIAKENSVACQKMRALGPYDVINLDLCDGFGAQAPGALYNYYEAISSLLSLQARTKDSWLLLLTTRADEANINPEFLHKLLSKYIDNLSNCTSFRSASHDKFKIDTKAALEAAVQTPDGLLSVFLVGVCKWFLGLALAHQPPTSVKLCSVVGYRVTKKANHEDLVSLALKFKPTLNPVKDPLGVAQQNSADPDECKLSTEALEKVAKRIDADEELCKNTSLLQTMIDETADLLALARYDTEAYKDWVKTA